jgi:hypothetical protein
VIEFSPTHTFPPINRCIYCGTAIEALSDEHILAYALGGTLILPKASCAKCANVTKKIEQVCARRIFGAYRIKTGMPTRRPKERPSHLRLDVVTIQGEVSPIHIAATDHPAPLALLVWGPPAVFQSGVPGAYIPAGVRIHFPDSEAMRHRLTATDAKGISINFRDTRFFARILAKIAYSFAVATDRVSIQPAADQVRCIFDETVDYLPFIGGDINDKTELRGVLH